MPSNLTFTAPDYLYNGISWVTVEGLTEGSFARPVALTLGDNTVLVAGGISAEPEGEGGYPLPNVRVLGGKSSRPI